MEGCVNDAKDWEQFFGNHGFITKSLHDEEATLKRILESIQEIVQDAVSGDVVAIQYSGHGTSVPDTSGDEEDGDDEALVPFDYETNGSLVDDDIGPVLDMAPKGVAISLFFDCCCSGGSTRMFTPKRRSRGFSDQKVRFLRLTPELIETHEKALKKRRDAAKRAKSRGFAEIATNPAMREVLFAACQSHESALEVSGQGLFTQAALRVLKQDFSGHSNSTVMQEIIAELGANRTQTPQLSCPQDLVKGLFLASNTRDESSQERGRVTDSSRPLTIDDVSTIFESLSKSLRNLG